MAPGAPAHDPRKVEHRPNCCEWVQVRGGSSLYKASFSSLKRVKSKQVTGTRLKDPRVWLLPAALYPWARNEGALGLGGAPLGSRASRGARRLPREGTWGVRLRRTSQLLVLPEVSVLQAEPAGAGEEGGQCTVSAGAALAGLRPVSGLPTGAGPGPPQPRVFIDLARETKTARPSRRHRG